MTQAEKRTCRTCEAEFRIDSDDFGFYERMGVPAPAICPTCRFQRRAAWRNEKTLYKRDCGLCHKSVITMYSPDAPYIIYCQTCWYSDSWDPASYAMDYDESRPFLEQLGELIRKVPKCSLYISSALGPVVNTEYGNFIGASKNGYMLFNSSPTEDSAYSRGVSNSKDIYDSYFVDGSERVYEGVNVEKSAGVAFGQNVFDCLDSWFLLDCTGCQNCFASVNSRHGSYLFLNEKMEKEEWRREVGSVTGSYSRIQEMQRKFQEHALQFPRRENANFKCVDSTGNYLYECKNCKDCFETANSENVSYSSFVKLAKDSYDILGHGRKTELFLEAVASGIGTRVISGWWVEGSHDVEYSSAIIGGEYCFGCDALKKGSYSILNKRYLPEEYNALREKIVKEMTDLGEYGLFFPPEMAPFGYNETIGSDNKPMTEAEALARGFKWQANLPETRGKETMKPEAIPDHIKDVEDSILDEILACVDCGRNYRLIKAELEMYRKAIIPVPRRCFNCRYDERILRRGPFAIFDRACAKCSKAIRTSYAPDKPDIVYCEQCYQAEVV